jgi:hypothetical protein
MIILNPALRNLVDLKCRPLQPTEKHEGAREISGEICTRVEGTGLITNYHVSLGWIPTSAPCLTQLFLVA